MSTSSIFRTEAVVVTAPRCIERANDAGVVTVEDAGCEDLMPNSNNSSPSKNSFMRFLEQSFVGIHEQKSQELEEMSIADRPVNIVPMHPSQSEDVLGFDACREYSYSADEDDDNNNNRKSRSMAGSFSTNEQALLSENALSTYVLGRLYHPVHGYTTRRDDESSLFWFTYRCDFPEISPYNITSDAGWGCMLRSAQMLLAHALRLHYKSRGWRPVHSLVKRRQDPFIRSMLTWFADFPSSTENLYSLHNMVAAGFASYDKLPGEWYGPGTACYVIRDLCKIHEQKQLATPNVANSDQRMFRVHVASQASVYRNVVEDLMTRDAKARMEEARARKEKECPPKHPLDLAWEEELVESVDSVAWDTALLLLIPLRLGLKSFNEDYVQAVAHTFSLPQSVGVLGGRPRGARWFYGAVSDGSKIFGLDPHTVQTAPRKRAARVNGKASSVVELSDEYMRSVHTTYPEAFSLQKMDPSVALGFYCKSRADLEHVFESLKKWKQEHPRSPELFTVADTAPNYSSNVSTAMDDMLVSSMCGSMHDEGQVSDEDEYVML